jgi:hypothetical protein
VSARAEGFVPSEPVDVLRPLQAPVSLVLTKGGTLEGRVVDARGFPIYGVTLEVVGTSLQGAPIADDPRRHAAQASQFERVFSGPKPLMGAGELGVVPGPVPAIPKAFAATKWVSVGATKVAIPVDPWVTRSDGTFRAEPVTPGRVRVVAHHPLFVEGFSELLTLLPGARREVNLVLHAGGFLEGRVVDSTGRAVPGARVVVAAIRGAFERMTSAASDGTFAFAAVPDAVSVLVTAQGENETLMSARIDVTVPEGGRRKVSLTLPPPRGVLNLRAKDERGSNLDNVQVRAMSLDPASPYRVTAFSNKDGEIRLLGAKGLPLRLECSAPHHAPKTVKVLPSADLVNIVLGPSEVLKGHVRTARVGEPISGAEVTVVAGVAPRRVVSGADGTFRADDLPPGPVELRVRAPGFAPTSVSLRTTEGRRRDGLVVVELGPEAVVEGTVVDSRGTPVAGARVARDHVPTYVPAGALPAEVAVTDRDGHFVLRELPEGSLHLEAFAADVGRGSLAEVRTVAGRTRSGVTILLKNEALADGRDALSSGGVAITLGERAGDVPEVVIASVSAQSEAERAGLRAGDVLVAIDGENVEGMEKARQRLSGPLGDDVILTVRRPDTEQSFRVPRERVNR